MVEHHPPGMLGKALLFVRSLELTHVLIIALIAIIAVPTYFAYRFIADTEFRREFLQNAIMVDKHVPCIVLEGHRLAQNTRHTMLFVYGLDANRMEKVIGLRAPGVLSDTEIDEACKRVLAMASELRDK